MSTPAWILEAFAAVMLLVAEVSAGQLVAARGGTRRGGADVVVSRLLTGIAVAGILVPGLRTLPNAGWEAAFAVMTAWFAWCRWRENRGRAAVARGHHAADLVHSAALLYVFAALAAPPQDAGIFMDSTNGMAGMSSGGVAAFHSSTLTLIVGLLLIAFTVRDLDRRAGADDYRQSGGGPVAYAAQRLLLSPAVVRAGRVATGVALAFILIVVI